MTRIDSPQVIVFHGKNRIVLYVGYRAQTSER